jgi:hypothetical protein
MATAKLLRTHAAPEWRWSHFPAGEARDARTGARLKAMDLQRGCARDVTNWVNSRRELAARGLMDPETGELL